MNVPGLELRARAPLHYSSQFVQHAGEGRAGKGGTKLLTKSSSRTELIPPGRRNLIKQIIYVKSGNELAEFSSFGE